MTPFLPQCTAGADARTCEDGCTYLRGRLHVLAGKVARTCGKGCTYLRGRLHVLAGKDARTCTLEVSPYG